MATTPYQLNLLGTALTEIDFTEKLLDNSYKNLKNIYENNNTFYKKYFGIEINTDRYIFTKNENHKNFPFINKKL